MLSSGALLPQFGLGTFKLKGEICQSVVIAALSAGYRLIDTARVYKNEIDIGIAIQRSRVPRSDIFLTTKIPPTEQGEAVAYAAVLNSLENLQTTYLDLVLIHWPGKAKTPLDSELNLEARRDTWKALIRAKREGLIRDIGTSNFNVRHLSDACFQLPRVGCATDEICELPSVNQVECHPACLQEDVRAYCVTNSIVFQAYSSLCCGDKSIYDNPKFVELLQELYESSSGRIQTPQQLLLTWGLQHGMHVIPKSSSPERVIDNYTFMQIALQEEYPLPTLPLRCLDALLLPDGSDRHLCWNSNKVS